MAQLVAFNVFLKKHGNSEDPSETEGQQASEINIQMWINVDAILVVREGRTQGRHEVYIKRECWADLHSSFPVGYSATLLGRCLEVSRDKLWSVYD